MNKPGFNGLPLSSMLGVPMQHFQNLPQLWIWTELWQSPPDKTYTNETAQELRETGWIESPNSSTIATQLYPTARLIKSDKTVSTWYKPSPAKPDPPLVILAFSIQSGPEPGSIMLLNPLPVPQMGEYGLVENNGGMVPYHIMSLPLEARQRWTAIGDALRNLSTPLMWPPFTIRHRIASNEFIYHRELQSVQIQQELALGDTKAQLMVTGAMLMAAKKHVEELHKALDKTDWIDQWREIQNMVQDLAWDYQKYHLQQQTPLKIEQTPLPLEMSNDPVPITQKKARATRTKKTPTKIVARRSPTIAVSSDIINREIINALRDQNTYKQYPEQSLAEHKHRFHKDRGQIIITIQPLEGESWETVIHALNTLGDGCIDTYIATLAIAMDKNGVDRIRTPFQISPDDILELCGKKKSNGSYTPLRRAEVIKHLKTLSQTRVIATMPGRAPSRGRGRKKDDGTIIRAEGALIDLLSFRIGEYHTITGEEVWEKRSIAIGEWATMIPELNSKTATMLRQVLAYSGKNERYQKRLGIYLTFMFRINARFGGSFPHDISMAALLEGAGIVPDKKNPGRFFDAIIMAFKQLKTDKVIGDYWQVLDNSEEKQLTEKEITERAYGWADKRLQTMWNFSMPEHIKEQYRTLLKSAQKNNTNGV